MAATQDLQRLVVSLEARIDKYTKEMAKAGGVTRSALGKMEGEIRRSESRQVALMGQMGAKMGKAFDRGLKSHLVGIGRGVMGGIIGSLGFDALRRAIESVGNIGDLARDLGITTDALQIFQKAMQLGGGRAEDMTKAIANMQDELGDADSVLSRFAKANNLDSAKLSVEQMFQSILKLSQALPPEERLRLFRDGLKLKPGAALDLAEAATHIAEAGKAARISAQDIAKLDKLAESMTDGFQQAGVMFGNFLAQVSGSGDATAAIQAMAEAFGAVLKTIQEAVDMMRQLDAWMKSTGIDQWFRTNGPFGTNWGTMRPSPMQGQAIPTQRSFSGDVTGSGFVGTPQAFLKGRSRVSAGRIEDLDPDFARRLANAIAAAEAATGGTAGIISAKRSYNEQADIYARSGQGTKFAAARPGYSQHEFGRAVDMLPGPVRDWIQAHATEFGLGPASSKRGWGFDPPHIQAGGVVPPMTKDQLDAERERLRQAREGRTATAAPKTTAADIDYLKSEMNIDHLTELYAKQQEQLEATTAASNAYAEQLSGTVGSAVSGLVNDLMNGVEAGEALSNMFKRLASQLVDQAIQQLFSFGGAPGGLFGQLFGGAPAAAVPGRADGGPVASGGAYVVGERGPELFMPKTPGIVLPNGRGGRGDDNLAVTVTKSKLFDVEVARVASRLDAGTLRSARRGYPQTASRFEKLGTV